MMAKVKTDISAGINGNRHNNDEIEHYGPLYRHNSWMTPLPFGVAYLGDGEWTLPEGAEIDPAGGDDWLLTMPDDKVFYVWSEG